MLNEEVGLENFPNVFIRSIDLFGTDDQNLVVSEVTLIARDVLKNGSYQWFNDSLFENYVNVSLLFSSEERISNLITNGVLSLNKNDLFSNYSNADNRLSLFNKSVLNCKGPVFSGLDKDGNQIHEFSYTFKHTFLKDRVTHIFAAMTLDNADLQRDFAIDPNIINYSFYQGPITSELVMSNGVVTEKSFYFTNPDGSIWKGPVHSHENQYMAGAFHTDTPHNIVQLNTISNFKINNNISNNSLKENESFKKDNKSFYFGNFWHTFDTQGNLNVIFNYDISKIYLEKSAIGGLIKNKSTTLFNEIVSTLKIDRFKIMRVLVKKSPYQEISSELSFIGRPDVMLPPDQAFNVMVKPIEMPFGSIKFVQYKDFDFKKINHGNYKYSFQLKFRDTTQKFLNDKLKKYKNDIFSLEKYYQRSSNKRNYDFDSDSFKLIFYEREKNVFGENLEELKSKIDNFIELKNYLFDFQDGEKKNLSFSIFSNINPKNGKPQGISLFIQEYQEMLDLFTQKLVIEHPAGPFRTKISKKAFFADRQPQTIVVDYMYDYVFDSVEDKTGYVLFDDDDEFSHEKYDNKIFKEKRRFFMTNPSFKKEDRKKLNDEEIEAISDISTFAPSFFTPMALHSRGKKIDLSTVDAVNNELLNEVINKNILANTNVINKRITLTLADTDLNSDGDSVYENASTYLGEESKLSNVSFEFTLQELEEQKTLKTRDKIQYPIVRKKRRKLISNNFNISKKNNAIYKKKRGRLARNRLRKLPPQYKSLVFSKSDTVRSTVLNSPDDLIQNPLTANNMFIQFFNVKIVEYLDSFEIDKSGMPNVKKPIWKTLDVNSKNTIKNKTTLCRVRNYNDKMADIEIPDYLDFQVFNKYFVLFASDSNELSLSDDQLLSFDSLDNITYTDYTTSNIVTQSEKINGSIQSTRPPSPQTDTTNQNRSNVGTRTRRTTSSPRRVY